MSASLEDIEALLDSPSPPETRCAVNIMDFSRRVDDARTAGGDLYGSICDATTGSTRGILSTVRHHMSLAATCGTSRRTAVPACRLPELVRAADLDRRLWFFIRRGDLDDTFRIGQILANDPHDLVQKAVGGWIRNKPAR